MADSKNSGKFSSDAERSMRRSTSGCIKGNFRTFTSNDKSALAFPNFEGRSMNF